jgi:hypothetical protein
VARGLLLTSSVQRPLECSPGEARPCVSTSHGQQRRRKEHSVSAATREAVIHLHLSQEWLPMGDLDEDPLRPRGHEAARAPLNQARTRAVDVARRIS